MTYGPEYRRLDNAIRTYLGARDIQTSEADRMVQTIVDCLIAIEEFPAPVGADAERAINSAEFVASAEEHGALFNYTGVTGPLTRLAELPAGARTREWLIEVTGTRMKHFASRATPEQIEQGKLVVADACGPITAASTPAFVDASIARLFSPVVARGVAAAIASDETSARALVRATDDSDRAHEQFLGGAATYELERADRDLHNDVQEAFLCGKRLLLPVVTAFGRSPRLDISTSVRRVITISPEGTQRGRPRKGRGRGRGPTSPGTSL